MKMHNNDSLQIFFQTQIPYTTMFLLCLTFSLAFIACVSYVCDMSSLQAN